MLLLNLRKFLPDKATLNPGRWQSPQQSSICVTFKVGGGGFGWTDINQN